MYENNSKCDQFFKLEHFPTLEEVDQFAMVLAMVLQTPQNPLQHFCNSFYTIVL
jgi:hypothetical protein